MRPRSKSFVKFAMDEASKVGAEQEKVAIRPSLTGCKIRSPAGNNRR